MDPFLETNIYHLYLPSACCVFMCNICVCTQRSVCMCVCVCLCVSVYAYVCIAFSFFKILLLAMVSLKGMSVSVIVKDNHLLLWSSPPGCGLPLPSSPLQYTSGWVMGWLAFTCHRSVCRKQAYLYTACEYPF